MNAKSFSLLAAFIFAAIAAVQLVRALSAWNVSFEGALVPVYVSYIIFVVFAGLAWMGLAASRK